MYSYHNRHGYWLHNSNLPIHYWSLWPWHNISYLSSKYCKFEFVFRFKLYKQLESSSIYQNWVQIPCCQKLRSSSLYYNFEVGFNLPINWSQIPFTNNLGRLPFPKIGVIFHVLKISGLWSWQKLRSSSIYQKGGIFGGQGGCFMNGKYGKLSPYS